MKMSRIPAKGPNDQSSKNGVTFDETGSSVIMCIVWTVKFNLDISFSSRLVGKLILYGFRIP